MYSFKTLNLLLKVQTISQNPLFYCRTQENGLRKEKFTSGKNGQLRTFYLFHCFS